MTVEVCTLIQPTASTGSTPGGQHAVMSYQLWPINQGGSAVLNYSFLNGTDYQRSAVRKGMDTWSKYANVIFQSTNSADIRISFSTTEETETCLGTTARNVTDKTKQTMRLKGIDTDAPKESKKEAEQAGLILHELGHVLGLLHEHQSPARGGRIKLDVNAVLRHYRIHYPGWTDDDIQQNVIIPYERAEAYNMSSLDMNSIMMYAMPEDLNEEGVEIPYNKKLSAMDRAFIMLNYPRKTPDPEEMSWDDAFDVARIDPDSETGKEIYASLQQEDYPRVRLLFSLHNADMHQMSDVNRQFLNSINPNNSAQSGILDTVSKVFENPLFRSAVKNIVNQVFVQRGIQTATPIPGTDEKNVLDTIGTLITNPVFAKAVQDINTELTGLKVSTNVN